MSGETRAAPAFYASGGQEEDRRAMKRTLFIVDDDPELRRLIQRLLEREGHEVRVFADAESVTAQLERLRPDLMVLDWMLPGESGVALTRQLRAGGDDLPIILLTAREGLEDRIDGLSVGADDYIAKPFDARELVLRVEAVLRRKPPVPASPVAAEAPVAVGTAHLDLTRRALVRGKEVAALTDGEFALLHALVRHPFTPLSRARLSELAHREGTAINDRSIDVAILRLRRLVEPDPGAPVLIQTVRGVGYVYAPPRDA